MSAEALRVAVYTIALDERGALERWLASAADADVVWIGDTGSVDGTGGTDSALT